jgi:hypothetical protein
LRGVDAGQSQGTITSSQLQCPNAPCDRDCGAFRGASPTRPRPVLLIGIDAFLDIGRTMTNVIGNGVATAVVANWENELGGSI